MRLGVFFRLLLGLGRSLGAFSLIWIFLYFVYLLFELSVLGLQHFNLLFVDGGLFLGVLGYQLVLADLLQEVGLVRQQKGIFESFCDRLDAVGLFYDFGVH